MSDFTNGFWPLYVGIISLVSILACGWLLWVAGKAKVNVQPGGDNTTGHVWDEDLRELNNPLPRWWMWLFIFTVVLSLVYVAVFPGLGSFPGLMKWSTTDEHQEDVARLRERVAPLYASFSAKPAEMLARDPAAMAIGERLFMNNCSQCHGSDARGSKSYPNLTNASGAWLGERGAEHIVQTITKGRTGVMPPMGAAIGGDPEISELANYVLSLSSSPHDRIKASSGKARFASCAACHGVDGKGNTALGAPNLSDDYWLHGWGEAAIADIVKNGKNNVMPAQAPKLSAEQIHVVAAYVLSLSASNSAVAQPTALPIAQPTAQPAVPPAVSPAAAPASRNP